MFANNWVPLTFRSSQLMFMLLFLDLGEIRCLCFLAIRTWLRISKQQQSFHHRRSELGITVSPPVRWTVPDGFNKQTSRTNGGGLSNTQKHSWILRLGMKWHEDRGIPALQKSSCDRCFIHLYPCNAQDLVVQQWIVTDIDGSSWVLGWPQTRGCEQCGQTHPQSIYKLQFKYV